MASKSVQILAALGTIALGFVLGAVEERNLRTRCAKCTFGNRREVKR